MSVRSNDSLINKLRLFSKSLPNSAMLFTILFLVSMGTGIGTVALINYSTLASGINQILVSGFLTGFLVIMFPTLLTVTAMKFLKRYVKIKYLLFISLIASAVYCVFVLLSSSVYFITSNYSLANAIVLVGDAGIFGFWFFISKVLFAQKKKAILFSLIQPLFNILLYASSNRYIFTFAVPFSILIIKLFAGILIFLVISYLILYILDSPLKRNLGFGGVDVFSEMVQNWLFDIDIAVAKPGAVFGTKADVDTQTIVLKRDNGTIKAIFFAPWLHYGPVGTLGGSNFPLMMERHALYKYKAPAFVMHCTVDQDQNPVSSSQINALKAAFDKSVAGCRRSGSSFFGFSRSEYGNSKITLLTLDGVRLATFTRAPRVTEDVSPEASRLFRELLDSKFGDCVLIDAHNSRYESAPEKELEGVRPNSVYMDEYVNAIKRLDGAEHKSRRVRVGVSSIEIYDKLGWPPDLAPGKLNVAVFIFNGFKHAMIQFNANNMMPSLRNAIIKHAKDSYGVDAEVYTSDTHFVNSIGRSASNVLGRSTKPAKLIALVDHAVKEALANAEYVNVYHKGEVMKNFRIWGPDVREKAVAVMTSIAGIAKVLVPTIVVAGFIIAALIISLV